MKCPLCNSTKHIEIDLHADGYCQDALECGDCGGIWTYCSNQLKIIKNRHDRKATAFSDFICPTCKAVLCIETDLDAFLPFLFESGVAVEALDLDRVAVPADASSDL